MEPPPELRIGRSRLLRVIKALYWFSEDGDNWYTTQRTVVLDGWGMRPFHCNPPCDSNIVNKWLLGLATTPVEDTVDAGQDGFDQDTDLLDMVFEYKTRTTQRFTFRGSW